MLGRTVPNRARLRLDQNAVNVSRCNPKVKIGSSKPKGIRAFKSNEPISFGLVFISRRDNFASKQHRGSDVETIIPNKIGRCSSYERSHEKMTLEDKNQVNINER